MKLSIIPSEQYPHHELDVQDWFAKKEEFYSVYNIFFAVEGSIQCIYAVDNETPC